MASWSDHANPYAPDPREATCVRWNAKGKHVYRDANFSRERTLRCIHCGRVKGRRYPKPKVTA